MDVEDAMNEPSGHLADERIQALLDDRLPAEERAAVRAHLDECGRCRARTEGWRAVFARLEGLPDLSPSPEFAEGVMEELPVRRPLAARIREWIGDLLPGPPSLDGHLEPEMVLSYLDRALSRRRRARVEGHLESCPACRSEVGEWRRLFRQLRTLERLAPSEGFAESVMAHVSTRETVPAGAGMGFSGRIAVWIEKLRPRSRKGWAVTGGLAAAPALAVTVGALALFSNPLLTPANLVTFLWWEASAAATALLGGAARSLMESPILFQAWQAAQALAASPTLAGAGILAFSAVTLTALWVLYRNLITTSTVGRGYANVPG